MLFYKDTQYITQKETGKISYIETTHIQGLKTQKETGKISYIVPYIRFSTIIYLTFRYVYSI